MSTHRPPHILLDNTWYIISAATLHHAPLLASLELKHIVREDLHASIQKFNITLRAWVILNDHYHLLLKTSHGHDLARFIAHLHGRTARRINMLDGVTGRQVWQNYWDTCIRTELEYWTRFNYIHNNPVKHGYVQRPAAWAFSSYHYYCRTKGEEWVQDCWSRYPIVETLEGDDFGDVEPGDT